MPRNLADLLAEIRILAEEAASFLATLRPLSLSTDEAVEGAPIVVDIRGATAGGAVEVDPPDGLTFDPVALTIAGTPSTVGEYEITLRETHPQGSNSPNLSTAAFVVLAKPVQPVGPWGFADASITFDRVDVYFDGTTGSAPTPVQNFAFGVRSGTPSESTEAVQRFTFGTRSGSPAEGSEAMQRFTFGTPTTTPSE